METTKRKAILPVIYYIFVALLFYGGVTILYYYDMINVFFLLGALCALTTISCILVICFRNNKDKRNPLIFVVLLFFALFFFDTTLVEYEGHTYRVTAFEQPEELIEQSGLHILSVALYNVYYAVDERIILDSYKRENKQIFNMYEVSNRDRYISRYNTIKQYIGFNQVTEFQTMGHNVNHFFTNIHSKVSEFLNRENLQGNSAGLALGLSQLYVQGEFENKVPITVTGTLEKDGTVLGIGMVEEKIKISEQSGFHYMMVPKQNEEEAHNVKVRDNLSIEIIAVSHINEAILKIQEINES